MRLPTVHVCILCYNVMYFVMVHVVHLFVQHDQLVLLEDQINQKIHSSDSGTDVGYWEALLQQLKAHMARVSLHIHALCTTCIIHMLTHCVLYTCLYTRVTKHIA